MKVTSKIKINQTAIKAITAKAQVIPRMDGYLQGEAMFVDKS